VKTKKYIQKYNTASIIANTTEFGPILKADDELYTVQVELCMSLISEHEDMIPSDLNKWEKVKLCGNSL